MGHGRVDFDRGITRLGSYARSRGHANPRRNEIWLEWRIGLWVANVRAKYRSGKLSAEQVSEAEAIGMRLVPPYRDPKPPPPSRAQRSESEMLRRLAQLDVFFNEHGHINVRQHDGIPGWPGAGRWIARLRQKYRRTSLPLSVVRKAEEMGINWNPGPGARL